MTDAEFSHRAAVILRNLSLERIGFWRQFFRRWHMSSEPLRHDAANLLRQSNFSFALTPINTRMVGDAKQENPND